MIGKQTLTEREIPQPHHAKRRITGRNVKILYFLAFLGPDAGKSAFAGIWQRYQSRRGTQLVSSAFATSCTEQRNQLRFSVLLIRFSRRTGFVKIYLTSIIRSLHFYTHKEKAGYPHSSIHSCLSKHHGFRCLSIKAGCKFMKCLLIQFINKKNVYLYQEKTDTVFMPPKSILTYLANLSILKSKISKVTCPTNLTYF